MAQGMFEFPYADLRTAINKLGDKEAFSCVRAGWLAKQYRKAKNMREAALREIFETDPRFAKEREELDKKLGL